MAKAHLVINVPAAPPMQVALEKTLHLLGRGEKCDIRMSNITLSRVHSQITRNGDGRFFIRDAGSQNGTFFNGAPLQDDHLMENGETFLLGNVSVTYVEDDAPSSVTLELDHNRTVQESAPPPATAPAAIDQPSPANAAQGDIPTFRTNVSALIASHPDILPSQPMPLPQVSPPQKSEPQPIAFGNENQTVLFDEGETEYFLEVVAGPQVGLSREASGTCIVIGRSPDCDFVLNDPTISRKHAMIFREGEGHVITIQKDTSNKLYVNGELCDRRELRHKDRIRIGKTQILYRLKNAPPEEAGPAAIIVQPKVEVRMDAPQAASRRLRPIHIIMAVVLLMAADFVWLDPLHLFHSKLESRMAEIARMERDGQFYKALLQYQELLEANGGLSDQQKMSVLEKKGLAHFEHATSLLESGDTPQALSHFKEAMAAITQSSLQEQSNLEGRVMASLLKYAERMLDKKDFRRAEQVVLWLKNNLDKVAGSPDFSDLNHRFERFKKAGQTRDEAFLLADKDDLEGALRLLERCLLESGQENEPCQDGRKQLARRAYDQSRDMLRDAENRIGREKGKLLDQAIRLLDTSSRIDAQSTLYRDALTEAKQKRNAFQSKDAVELNEPGFVLDKFKR